jgi:hypothetical protein
MAFPTLRKATVEYTVPVRMHTHPRNFGSILRWDMSFSLPRKRLDRLWSTPHLLLNGNWVRFHRGKAAGVWNYWHHLILRLRMIKLHLFSPVRLMLDTAKTPHFLFWSCFNSPHDFRESIIPHHQIILLLDTSAPIPVRTRQRNSVLAKLNLYQ